MIWMDVDTALAEVPVNLCPLITAADFITVDEGVTWNEAGMELYWHFVTTAGAASVVQVTPTTGGAYDWAHQDHGMYTIEMTATGGASANNDTEGFGYFTGKCTATLAWRGPTIGFRAAALNNIFVDGADIFGTPVSLDSGTATFAGMLAKMADDSGGAAFDAGTDSQEAIANNITAVSDASYAPDSSSTITTGNQDAGTYASCSAKGGAKWTIGDVNGSYTIDVICEFNMGASRTGSEVDVEGYFNRSGGGGYVCEVYAYNYTTSGWDKISGGSAATELWDRSADFEYVFSLLEAHTDAVTTAGEVKIRFRSTRTTTAGGDVLYLDYVRLTGQAAGATSPSAIAQAVWIHSDGHAVRHIPKFTGHQWFVDGTHGSDTLYSGVNPDQSLATIGASITAASAGDSITVFAGTYTETGIDLNLAGLELHGEIGAVIDPASGSALTISAAHCLVKTIEVRPAAGEIGFNIASGSDHSHLDNCKQTTTGATGFKIDSGTTYILITRSEACQYTSTGMEINGADCIIEDVVCCGQGGSETGFKLNHTNAHRNRLFACASIDNATASYHVITGADDNLFHDCADTPGCGARIDAGANNAWRAHGEADTAAANMTQILGTALTETSGYLAAGFKKFFNVATPTGTLGSIPDAVAGAAGGLFIAGTNAETTITTALNSNLIGNITGNLSGSVGSVTGAVGSVTGHTVQTGDSYAIVSSGTYGNAKLVRSTTPANALDVSATGEAGLDFNNVKNASGATTLTNITVPTVTTVGSVSGAVGSVGSGGITATSLGADCITAAKIADDAFVAANFATGCLTADAYAADALVAATFATGAFTADAFAADALVAATFATGAFTADAFAADALVAATFATDSFTADALAADAVAEIAASAGGGMWDALLASHVTADTFGEAVGQITGVGTNTVTITCNDFSGDPIEGAEVWITTDEAGTDKSNGPKYSTAMGTVVFQMDDGTYYAWKQKSGQPFDNPEEFTVEG